MWNEVKTKNYKSNSCLGWKHGCEHECFSLHIFPHNSCLCIDREVLLGRDWFWHLSQVIQTPNGMTGISVGSIKVFFDYIISNKYLYSCLHCYWFTWPRRLVLLHGQNSILFVLLKSTLSQHDTDNKQNSVFIEIHWKWSKRRTNFKCELCQIFIGKTCVGKNILIKHIFTSEKSFHIFCPSIEFSLWILIPFQQHDVLHNSQIWPDRIITVVIVKAGFYNNIFSNIAHAQTQVFKRANSSLLWLPGFSSYRSQLAQDDSGESSENQR